MPSTSLAQLLSAVLILWAAHAACMQRTTDMSALPSLVGVSAGVGGCGADGDKWPGTREVPEAPVRAPVVPVVARLMVLSDERAAAAPSAVPGMPGCEVAHLDGGGR